MIQIWEKKLIRKFRGETLMIEAWGPDALRVRVTRLPEFSGENWALLDREPEDAEIFVSRREEGQAELQEQKVNSAERIEDDEACIQHGKLRAIVDKQGKLIFENSLGKRLFSEYEAGRHSSLRLNSRELKGLSGGNFRGSLRLEPEKGEKLYGMGQYQNGLFDLKGSVLELAQRNSQITVPFVVSSRGYGFFWNNPAIGRATFGNNMTLWEAENTRQLDFWVTAGDSPKEILNHYMEVTGMPSVMPEHGLGFWQSKLRYRTQEELLSVAREYHRRGVPLDVIVADFFHWTLEGTWAFDPQYWPNPKAMTEELRKMGTKLMVSVWPTVSLYAPDYKEMDENNFLIRTEKGVNINKFMIDPTSFLDATNPEARQYLWSKIHKNYVSYGITDFWLDVAEPEYNSYDYENFRYYKGTAEEVGNEYPTCYTRIFYEGLKNEGLDSVNLVRCAWAGSQRYGALVWSGDILSTFEALKNQVVCGQQMAMCGIPWWTSDIGGFYDGNVEDPKFQELLIRWFEFGVFCPVMRLHGHRRPLKPALSTSGGGRCGSGADNEIWSFGEENYEKMKAQIELRESLRDYTRALMEETHKTGSPVMRPLFYEFPEDERSWETKEEYLYGDKLLVAPVTEYGQRQKTVYLPKGGCWTDAFSGQVYEGGMEVTVEAPLCRIPVFIREDGLTEETLLKFLKQYQILS